MKITNVTVTRYRESRQAQAGAEMRAHIHMAAGLQNLKWIESLI